MEAEPIRILELIAEEVGTPRNDGSPGSALYEVPFRLSRAPDYLWAQLFERTWDRPPSFTTLHRPGICKIVGDRLVLTRTTVEEVAQVHKETLITVLNVVNAEWERLERDRVQQEQRKALADMEQRKKIVDAAKQIRFDA